MDTQVRIITLVAVCCTLGAAVYGRSPQSAAAPLTPAVGASLRARDRLAELDNPALPRVLKAKLGVELLQDEIAAPTPIPAFGSADLRGHSDVLAAIVSGLQGADLAAIQDAWAKGDGELRSSLAVRLVLDGAPEPEGEVRDLLRDQQRHQLPMRLLAAQALSDVAGRTGDTELGQLFAAVMQDDRQWRYLGGKRLQAEYPVRKVVAEAIRKLEARKVPLDSYVPASIAANPLEFTYPDIPESDTPKQQPR